ncbi:MAG: FtsX-like permease family protein [Bifidobacterium breve]|uniref:ABC transporter permease n=1 Tax=Bifidobacterium breve TaxID=1685 RepID=UPI0022AE62E2|nr:FtsX-like permease family protein [Bifidobacterium breve]MCI2131080.1 FtsX-like permease family protein [Bifidobacterium breve]MDU2060234.1 FtsX-like permease family protein [Bifidobacterium breve]
MSVSAIGMINIGLAGIEQRSHELLIRRALGATRAGIAIQVIGSSVLLSLIIALAAVLISAVLVWTIPWMMPADSPLEPPAYPYTAAMIAACASIVTSLVGSLAPAIKAIRLQPALALR